MILPLQTTDSIRYKSNEPHTTGSMVRQFFYLMVFVAVSVLGLLKGVVALDAVAAGIGAVVLIHAIYMLVQHMKNRSLDSWSARVQTRTKGRLRTFTVKH